VAPFCVRLRPKAPVSTPLDWAEVNSTIVPSNFNLGNFAERLRKSKAWHDFFKHRQSLKTARNLLKKL
jgi:bifunctional non-homologous end joining protein LigD